MWNSRIRFNSGGLGRNCVGSVGIDISRLRPIDRIGTLDTPVFMPSGTLDRHTTIKEARALFSAASDPKDFCAIEGAAHVDLHQFEGAEYERRVAAFLDRYLNNSSKIVVVRILHVSSTGRAPPRVVGVRIRYSNPL